MVKTAPRFARQGQAPAQGLQPEGDDADMQPRRGQNMHGAGVDKVGHQIRRQIGPMPDENAGQHGGLNGRQRGMNGRQNPAPHRPGQTRT